jgi:hypothetical protein
MNTMQSHGTGVPDMIGSLSESDILASSNIPSKEPAVASPKRA